MTFLPRIGDFVQESSLKLYQQESWPWNTERGKRISGPYSYGKEKSLGGEEHGKDSRGAKVAYGLNSRTGVGEVRCNADVGGDVGK